MDAVSDFCTRLRNACRAKKAKVDIPSSHIHKGIADRLKDFGYIKDYTVVPDGRQGLMRLYLKYYEDGTAAITQIERVSRPSCRRYVKSRNIPDVLSGLGLLILSTNQGILSGPKAKEKKLGGELICRVW